MVSRLPKRMNTRTVLDPLSLMSQWMQKKMLQAVSKAASHGQGPVTVERQENTAAEYIEVFEAYPSLGAHRFEECKVRVQIDAGQEPLQGNSFLGVALTPLRVE
jgi:hypothetical protein